MMWLVPFEKSGAVKAMLEEYRRTYDDCLEYGHERLRDAIIETGLAKFEKESALQEGRVYGTIGYSASATAIRGNRQIPYHGEIYLYKWTWKHRLTRAHREKQLKMSCQALHNAPPNRT